MFVPITTLAKISSLEQGMKLANDVTYGLTTAGFYGTLEECDWFFDHIQAGVTYANRPQGSTTGRLARFPTVWRLERFRLDRQERWRPVLFAALHARANPHPGAQGLSYLFKTPVRFSPLARRKAGGREEPG